MREKVNHEGHKGHEGKVRNNLEDEAFDSVFEK